MAKATKTTVKQVVINNYTLVLSKEEAYFLTLVLGMIGGSINDSPRMYATEIRNALINTGIVPLHFEFIKDLVEKNQDNIHFNNNTLKSFIKEVENAS